MAETPGTPSPASQPPGQEGAASKGADYRTLMAQMQQEADALRPPEPDDTVTPDPAAPKPSFWDRVGQATVDEQQYNKSHPANEDASAAMLAGTVRAPGMLVGGLLDTAEDFSGLDTGIDYSNLLSSRAFLGKIGPEPINEATATLGSLVIGGEALGATRLFSWLPRLAKGPVTFGITGGLTSDPTQERLSNLVSKFGIENQFLEWIKAKPEDEGTAIGHFKVALEDSLTGLAFDGAFASFKWMVAIGRGATKATVDKLRQEAVAANAKAMPIMAEGKAYQASTAPQAQQAAELGMQDIEAAKLAGAQDAAKAAKPKPAKDELSKGPPTKALSDKIELENFTEEVTRRKAMGPEAQDVRKETDRLLNSKVGEVKLSPLGDPDSVPAILRSVVERIPASARPKSDLDLMTSAKAAADELGQDTNTILAAAENIAGSTRDVDTAVVALRTMGSRLSKAMDGWASRDIATLSDAEVSEALKDLHNAVTFSGHMMDVKTGLGRGERALGLPDADTYLKSVAKKADDAAELEAVKAEAGGIEPMTTANGTPIPPLPKNREELRDWMDLWKANGKDPFGKSNFLESLQKLPSGLKYFRTSVANLFTANVLAGTPSVMMNVIGPAVQTVIRTFEKTSGAFMASMVAPVVSRLGAGTANRAELLATARYAGQAYVQTLGDASDVLKFAWQATKGQRSVLGGGGTVADVNLQAGPITDGMVRAARGTPHWGYTLGNAINLWPRVFLRVNSGLDEMSKRIAYLGETRTNALVVGSGKGLKGPALRAFVRAEMGRATDEAGAATNEAMLRSAERTTFTGEVGREGSLTRTVARTIQHARQVAPELRFILPVFNVPAKALGETLMRVPVLNFAFKETREELAGLHGSVKQAEAYGRMMTGAALMITGYGMARAGQLTGPGPTNPEDRKTWLQTHLPYSMRIGDKWVNYSRYDVAGSLLGIPATMYDRSVNRPQDKDYENMVLAGTASLAQYFKDRAALQGLADVLNFGGEPTQSESTFNRLAGSAMTRLLVPNFVTQLGRNMQDSTQRYRTSPGDYLYDSLPWASQELDPVRNVLGETIHKPQDSLAENIVPLTMAPVVAYKDDPTLDELSRLYEVTGYAGGAASQADFSKGYFDSREVKLEDGRSLFDAIIRERLTPSESDGLSLRDRLQDLFNSPDYLDAPDGDANGGKTGEGETTRGSLIAKVFSQANKEAIQAVAEKSPVARRYLAVAKAKVQNDNLLRGYNAPELAHNPSLMDALGINIQDYEDQITP